MWVKRRGFSFFESVVGAEGVGEAAGSRGAGVDVIGCSTAVGAGVGAAAVGAAAVGAAALGAAAVGAAAVGAAAVGAAAVGAVAVGVAVEGVGACAGGPR